MKSLPMRLIRHVVWCSLLVILLGSPLVAADNDQEFKFYDPFNRLDDVAESGWDRHIIQNLAANIQCAEEDIQKDMTSPNTKMAADMREAMRRIHFTELIQRSVELATFVEQKTPDVPKECEAEVATAKFWSHYSQVKYSSDFKTMGKSVNKYVNANFDDLLKAFVAHSASHVKKAS